MGAFARAGLSAAGVVALLGLPAQTAHATAYGFAQSTITNFQILVDSGSLSLAAGANRTNTNQTTYNNLAGPYASRSTTTIAPNPDDTLQAFSGPNAQVVGQNNYSANAGRSAGLDGARSDSNTGAGNAFTANGGTVSGGGTGSGVLNNVAEALVSSGNVATGDGRSTGAGQFEVLGSTPVTLHFAFTEAHTMSATTTDPGDVAQVVMGNDFEITGPINFSYVPAAINLTQSSIDGGAPVATTGTAFFSSPEATLLPGTYNFTRRNESQVDLQSFPVNVSEPGALALLGSSLVGLGVIGRRKKATS